MKNFQCYVGDHEQNHLSFSEGLNLILGDNGGGKSKLYDAFYWVLYDQIFLSDTRSFVSTSSYKESLISDKAKKECDVGARVTTEVTIIATNVRDVDYRITRVFRAKKKGDRKWECDKSSTLIIDEKKSTRWVSVESSKYKSILNTVIPGHLKPYMWFQGEQVDSLLDFTDSSALTQVVNLLSDISTYDEFVKISRRGLDKAERDYQAANRKLSKDQNKSDELDSKIENLKRKIGGLEYEIKEDKASLQTAEIRIEELISKIGDAQDRVELKQKKIGLETEVDRIGRQLEAKYNGFNKKMFSDSWVLNNTQPFFEMFSNKYQGYYEEHISQLKPKAKEKVKLPIDIPQPVYVNQMLEEELCFVCGREAKEGSEAHDHINDLLNREISKSKEPVFENDCSSLFQRIYNNSLGFKHLVNGIDDRIKTEFGEIQSLNNDLRQKKSELDQIDEMFGELIGDDKSEDIVAAYRQHSNNKGVLEKSIADKQRKLDGLVSNREQAENDISKLVTGAIDDFVVDSKMVYRNLYDASVLARKQVFVELIEELEVSANRIFVEMTERNTSITGNIKLKYVSDDKYIPEIVDSDGYIIRSPNDSNIILVKLALIMAIVKSRANWCKNYALISDAPTAKMAEKYTYGFYQALGRYFKQCIVTTFDFLSPAQRDHLKGFNVGKVYQIEAYYPGGDRNDRSDLNVLIEEISI